MSKVFITGITGQDGAYLAQQMLDAGHDVYGAVRRGSTPKTGRLMHLEIVDKITLIQLEITEFSNVHRVLDRLKPDLIFNLAAQSFVQDSFDHPILTSQINFLGVQNILEAIKLIGFDCRFYQASTSEMYGDVLSDPQNENTPFNPMSPYAVAKCAAHHIVKNYRKAYGIAASNGILFNHESEMRGREFVTRKITHQLAELTAGRSKPIQLGNLSSVRDWGYAPDYVRGMDMIINSSPDDYVIATNTVNSVRDFFSVCARRAGYDPIFDGEGLEEKCIDKNSNKILCEVNPDYFRPSDVVYLRGDYSKMNEELGWTPETAFESLAEKMMDFDLGLVNKTIPDYKI
ncbi:GDP-mannose 4,6-dehydratase [Alphaproteobacteria bacterium]|nr:GDP-mannose 4,6-dehydratase [Alphaproteobacteria bacterium]